MFERLETKDLYTLQTVIVDYRGYRVVCQSIVPGTHHTLTPSHHVYVCVCVSVGRKTHLCILSLSVALSLSLSLSLSPSMKDCCGGNKKQLSCMAQLTEEKPSEPT